MDLTHLAFFSLMMTFVSLWIHRSAWLWGGFLIISYILAINTSVAQPFSLVPVGTLFVIFWLIKHHVSGGAKFALAVIAIAIAACLNFHWIPYFCNWHVSGQFWVNFDKPFIGLFPLALMIPLLRTPVEWYKMAMKAVPLTIVVIFLMAFLALSSGAINWQFKIPSYFFLRVAANLFLVVIPEEAFFRGFIQEEIYRSLGQGVKGVVGGILAASVLFALFHIGWTSSFAILGFTFLAGVLYGAVYQFVRSIESSIVCHFALNLTHMLFFSYHAE